MSKEVLEQNAFLLDFCRLVLEADRLGFVCTPGELLRTIDQQRLYYNSGRSKTLHSMHLIKRAGDLNFFLDGMYINALPAKEAKSILQPLGNIWEAMHPKNRWGGNFKSFLDCPHFERLQ